ncbi:MAG: DUF4349 domain-containing protein [Dehalococcoidia bacterium]
MKRMQWLLSGLVVLTILAGACSSESADDGAISSTEEALPAIAADMPAARQNAAATGGSAPAAAPDSAASSSQVADRKLMINATLDLVLDDVQSGFERIGAIAQANGGLVADSTMRQDSSGNRHAMITVRVSAGRTQETLAQIRDLAVKVESERSSANDVTEEYTDLEARQRNLAASEQQLLALLAQAKNVQEVLQVQDRLTSTRAEIERIKGRINLLTRLTDLATIQAQLRSEPASAADAGTGPLDALARGWQTSLEVVGGIALAGLTALAFSWWLLPLIAVAAWIVRREVRRRGAAA